MLDYVLENVWKAHGSPEFMFFDTRPAQYPLALIASHDIAEQLSRSTKQQPYSTTKSPTIQGGLGRLIGPYSLLSEEGESWKSLRKRFNPGFAPQHLLSLLPVVLDKTYIFMEKLDAVSASVRYLPRISIDVKCYSWRNRGLLPSWNLSARMSHSTSLAR
jgi:cytochrome P450